MKAKLVVEYLNDFKRGSTSKETLELGIAQKIDSDNLEDMTWLFGHKKPLTKEKANKRLKKVLGWDEGEDEPIEYMDMDSLLYLHDQYLKGNIEEGESFDHKEYDAMDDYLAKLLKKKYKGWNAYNGYSGGDAIGVIFSKIKFPNAEDLME